MIPPFQPINEEQGRLLYKGEASYWLQTYNVHQSAYTDYIAELVTDTPITDEEAQLIFSQGCPLRSGNFPQGFLGPYTKSEYAKYRAKNNCLVET